MLADHQDGKDPRQNDPDLNEMVGKLSQDELDLILVEGFKHVSFPRIEIHRPSLNKPLLVTNDASIIAVASDQQLDLAGDIKQLDLNDTKAIVTFILQEILGSEEEKR